MSAIVANYYRLQGFFAASFVVNVVLGIALAARGGGGERTSRDADLGDTAEDSGLPEDGLVGVGDLAEDALALSARVLPELGLGEASAAEAPRPKRGAGRHARRHRGERRASHKARREDTVATAGTVTGPSRDEVQAEPSTRALLTLMLNGVPRGEVLATFDGDDVLIEASALEGLGIDPGDDVIERGGVRMVSLSRRFGRPSFKIDDAALELKLTVDPSLLPPQRVDLGPRTPDMERIGGPSAFLNYGAHVSDSALTDPMFELDGFAELGVSFGPARLFGGVSLPDGRVPVRGLSNLTVDVPRHLLRLTVGDTMAQAGTLGGGAWMGGVQLGRAFELDPYFVPGPTIDQEASALTPSTLEVYVNGQLVHRQDVAPGEIDIANIPATVGAGDTRVVLTDGMGRSRELTASYYRHERLLGQGQTEFAVVGGLLREHLGTTSWDYGAPAAMGRLRVGVTPTVTVGGYAEGTPSAQSGGVEGVLGSKMGELSSALAVSHAPDAAGAAGALTVSHLGEGLDVTSWMRFQTASFANLNLDAAEDRSLIDLGATLSAPLTERISASASTTYSELRDAGTRARVSVSSGVQLPLNLHLSATGLWTRTDGQPDEIGASATLYALLGKRTGATVRGEVDDAAPGLAAELHRSLPTGSGLGYRVGGELGETDSAYGQVDAVTRTLRTSARLDLRPEASAASLNASSGVVLVGRHLYPTRPIEGAYAVVRVPGVAGVRTFLNNNEVGETDSNGDLVVTGLLPNYANRLSVADADIPLDFTVGATERVVAPFDRSGALVRFAVEPQRLVRGRLVVEGQDTAYGTLRVTTPDADSDSPLGKDGAFELTGLDVGAWTAEATWATGSCAVSFSIPEGGSGLLDLGDTSCDPTETRSTP